MLFCVGRGFPFLLPTLEFNYELFLMIYVVFFSCLLFLFFFFICLYFLLEIITPCATNLDMMVSLVPEITS